MKRNELDIKVTTNTLLSNEEYQKFSYSSFYTEERIYSRLDIDTAFDCFHDKRKEAESEVEKGIFSEANGKIEVYLNGQWLPMNKYSF